jgi:diacylglycerol kinase family enzyme
VVERLFLLKHWFLPFQFAGQPKMRILSKRLLFTQESDQWRNWFLAKSFAVAEPFVIVGVSALDLRAAQRQGCFYPPSTRRTRFLCNDLCGSACCRSSSHNRFAVLGMKTVSIDISELTVGAIINTSSGGCEANCEAEMLNILKDAGVTNYKIWAEESDKIERAFAEAAAYEPKVLTVLAGDGTIRTAAEACSGTDTYLLPLPGGTLNMLSRAVYGGDVSWQDALRNTLAAPSIKALSGGRTGDELFFVAAIIGAPGLWMEARESLRDRDIRDAVGKSAVAFQAMFDTKIRYSISSETSGEAEVLAITCPLVSETMSDAEQALEAAAIDVENALQLLGLATAAAFGKWRDQESVTLTKTRHVTVQSSKDIPLFLDGERINVGEKAEITFVSNAVNVVVPKSNHVRKES